MIRSAKKREFNMGSPPQASKALSSLTRTRGASLHLISYVQRAMSRTGLLDTCICTNGGIHIGSRGHNGAGKRFELLGGETTPALTLRVVSQTRTRRNQPTDNNIFLQPTQGVTRTRPRR